MATTGVRHQEVQLIAPCGINCRLCRAYGRARNPCAGCRAAGAYKSGRVNECSVHCARLAAGEFHYCYECDEFPCKRLLHLDRRYRTRYAASPVGNLARIKAGGIRQFVRDEAARWACPSCGELLCMHVPQCRSCGRRWRVG